jgi:hypothetical protein
VSRRSLPKLPARPEPKSPPAAPKGMSAAEALDLVLEAEARLWAPEGSEALAYLTGPRGLALGTIRGARLGWTSGVRLATKDGRSYSARGWIIPWFEGDHLVVLSPIPLLH